MFTGLIESVQPISSNAPTTTGLKLIIDLDKLADDAKTGDSIAVNGVCLTISKLNGSIAEFDVMDETIKAGNVADLKNGSQVNLERAMIAGGRFGGHIVQGHIDQVGTIVDLIKQQGQIVIWISAAPELINNIITKGSVAVDGISLTIAQIQNERFAVGIIPTTWQETNLHNRKLGDKVNLEADILGKWINQRLETVLGPKSNLSLKELRRQGF